MIDEIAEVKWIMENKRESRDETEYRLDWTKEMLT